MGITELAGLELRLGKLLTSVQTLLAVEYGDSHQRRTNKKVLKRTWTKGHGEKVMDKKIMDKRAATTLDLALIEVQTHKQRHGSRANRLDPKRMAPEGSARAVGGEVDADPWCLFYVSLLSPLASPPTLHLSPPPPLSQVFLESLEQAGARSVTFCLADSSEGLVCSFSITEVHHTFGQLLICRPLFQS
ncbi:MAG: hypothetical protein J3Q66DRAFT_354372 [Benniella sp.]|nr:MAG: hypothetical protein J3Q66DRAFT_359184 [Benniella sp.]KAK3806485.1 MAG: hypothetical protein J3Q66DRAFT_359258 [Benniella sp.]KAK3808268.1 MAG: hypothetical protein J3Q66DRAFT_354372 [Benniella sp.]